MTAVPRLNDLTISIIAMNRPRYLEAAISSLLETTPAGPHLQITLNGSDGETRKVAVRGLSQWPGSHTLLENDELLDFVAAHNRALSYVGTPFVNFMGDDDVNLEPRYERQLRCLRDPRVLAVGTFAYRVGGRPGHPVRALGRMDVGPRSEHEMRKYLQAGQPIYLVFPSVVMRTQAVKAIGGLRPQFGPAADIDLWARLAERGTIIAVPERLFGFRVHEESASTRLFFEARRLVRYAESCQLARSRGNLEPTLDEFLASQSGFSFGRVVERLRDASHYFFRRSGAAWLERRPFRTGVFLVASILCSPAAFVRKLSEQFGKRS